MNTKSQRFLMRVFMLALVAFLTLPMAVFAQGNGKHKGRGKPTDVFVNGHDARDGRWDKNNGQKHRNRDDRWDRNNDGRRNDDYYNRNQRNRNSDPYYGGSFDLRQTALNAGYNNGIQEGRRDRSRGERFEYRDESDYQRATEDYSSRFGDRELYRQYFRQGFANGYRTGYNGY